MSDTFVSKAAPLSRAGFDSACQALGGDAASLWALLTVETRGFGFLPDRRPKILFERHIFHQRTGGRFSLNREHADISAGASGGYEGGVAEYGRLARAIRLDRRAALESASWGLGQVMGFNAVSLRYVSTAEMVDRFIENEDAQLDGSVRFIQANPALQLAFAARRWDRVAFFYNGKAYAKNDYHTKLERYHELYTLKGMPSVELRAAQARLTYLGFKPRGVDGLLGDGTRTALIGFQKAAGLPVTSEPDDQTLEALKAAAGI